MAQGQAILEADGRDLDSGVSDGVDWTCEGPARADDLIDGESEDKMPQT